MELEEFTKAEIITWVKGRFYSHPKKSEMLFIRWQIQSLALQKREQANLKTFRAIDGKKHDEYARQCNATTDTGKKLALLKKMGKINKEFAAHFAEGDKINTEYDRVQKIYDQIEVERQKERKP